MYNNPQILFVTCIYIILFSVFASTYLLPGQASADNHKLESKNKELKTKKAEFEALEKEYNALRSKLNNPETEEADKAVIRQFLMNTYNEKTRIKREIDQLEKYISKLEEEKTNENKNKKICPGELKAKETISGMESDTKEIIDPVQDIILKYNDLYNGYVELNKKQFQGESIDEQKYEYYEGFLAQYKFQLDEKELGDIVPDWREVQKLRPYLDKPHDPEIFPFPKRGQFDKANELLNPLEHALTEYLNHLCKIPDLTTGLGKERWDSVRYRLADRYLQLQNQFFSESAGRRTYDAIEATALQKYRDMTSEESGNEGEIVLLDKKIDELEKERLEVMYIYFEIYKKDRYRDLETNVKGDALAEWLLSLGEGNAATKLDEINKKIDAARTNRRILEVELRELQNEIKGPLARGQSYANQLLKSEGIEKEFKIFDLNELTSDDISPYLQKLLGQRCTAIYNHQKGLRVKVIPTRKCR